LYIFDISIQSSKKDQVQMSSKKAMKQMQKLAFQKHKNNIKNNKFKPKTNKIFNKHKK